MAIITGTSADDILTGTPDPDTITGGLGNDDITGDAGDDRITMLVTAGNEDTIDAGADTDTLVLSGVVPGDLDVVWVDLASTTDQVVSIGNSGVDTLTQINFENLDASGIGSSANVTGSEGANSIIGSKGNDIIDGGAGDDNMAGGRGDDLYLVEGTGDVVTEGLNAGTDTVVATLNYTLGANQENLTLTGPASDGTGNARNNILTGNTGNNALSGLAGNDTLTGRAGDDQLNGGLGADFMIGGLGDDTYVIDNLGDGIRELAGDGTDTIQINRTVDLNVAPFTAIENVVLTGVAAIKATGDDGNNLLTGNNGANILIGSFGDDTLNGGLGNDTLNGGPGTDALNGGEGNDTYRLDMFGDNDTITESGGTDTTVIVANGVDLSGLNFEQSGNDLVASLFGASTTTVDQYAGLGGKVESLRFEGGASFAGYGAGPGAYLLNTDAGDTGGAQQDLIAGSSASETLDGMGGNDLLFGNGDADTLIGGTGNDFLVGGAGQDTVDGSVGNDFVVMDVTTGDVDEAHGGVGTDTLVLTGGDPFTFAVVEVDLSVADQVVSIGGVAEALVQDGFENLDASGLAFISFDSVNVTGSAGANTLIGSFGDDTMNGGLGNDTLNGGFGNDVMDGGEGNDTYRLDLFGGNDTITESGGTDTTVIVANGADLSGLNFENSGDDLVASLSGTPTTTVVGQYAGGGGKVESLRFEGGASFAGYGAGTGAYLLNTDAGDTGGAQQDLIAGSSASETLNGVGGNDLLFGNGGADTLIGGTGNDFLVGGTDEDTVDGSVGNDFVVMQVTTGDVDEAHGGTGTDTLVLSGVVPGNHVVVADLSVADQVVSIGGVADALLQDGFENLDASGLGSSVNATGSAGANLLIGSNGDDTMNGGAGNDTLNGGLGDDVMDGGVGNDTYVVNSSADSVTETGVGAAGGKDLVQSSAATFELEDNIENLTLLGIGNINGTGNELANIITGNSGNNQLMGLDGKDQLLGGAGNDILDGGSGADKMAGGLGDDTYVVDVPTDVVTEALNAGTDDTVQSSINYTLRANVEHLTLTGLTGLENLNGTGNTLNNSITGNDGDNTLSGLAGNDILRGGLGNDTVNGGTGHDTFLFGQGDGQDVVKDSSGTADQISFGAGIDPLDLVISRQANDLRLAIHGTSDQITVQNWYSAPTTAQVETIQAGNGEVLLSTQVDQLIQAMALFTITTGVSWDDASGGAGDQTQFQDIIAASWQ